MKLRQLEIKDANKMLEWMHNKDVVRYFRFDSMNMTYEDVLSFIEKSHATEKNKHFAVIDENDEYMGTISLKNIDVENCNAEYAICLHTAAIGKNVAKEATNMILDYAFNTLQLQKVYLNVLADNVRAIKFYEKYGFIFEGEFRKHLMHEGELKDVRYYAAFNSR